MADGDPTDLQTALANTVARVEELDKTHTLTKEAREEMSEHLQDTVMMLEDLFPGERRMLAELLEGERQRIMSEITASQARRSASARKRS